MRRLAAALLTGLAVCLATTAQAQQFIVTNGNDSGVGSLRQAITDANAYSYANGGAATATTITIQPGVGTITLSSNLPLVGGSTAIVGNGATLDGASAYRGFLISGIASNGQSAATTAVTISNLTIENVKAQGGNGAATLT